MNMFFVPKDMLLMADNMAASSSFTVQGFPAGAMIDVSTMAVTVSSADVQPWTPAQISGAQWFDIANGVGITYATSPNVTTVADANGGSNFLTQSMSGKYPQLISSAYNGKNALRFDGSDDFIDFNTAIPAGSHIFIVTKTNTYKNYGVVLNHATEPSGLHSGQSGEYLYGADAARSYLNDLATGIPIFPSASKIFSTLSLLSVTLNYPMKRISAGNAGGDARNCDICGIVVVPGIASIDTRLKLIGYFAHLLAFASSLHANNPYKISPPTTGQATVGHRYVRLTISKYRYNGVDGSSPGTDVRVSELQLFDAIGNKYPARALTGASATTPFVVTKSSEQSSTFAAWKAFDAVISDSGRWISDQAGGEQWVQIDLGEEVALTSVKLSPDGAASSGYYPVDFRIEGSNTGAFSGEQALLLSVVGATSGWANNTLRTFTV